MQVFKGFSSKLVTERVSVWRLGRISPTTMPTPPSRPPTPGFTTLTLGVTQGLAARCQEESEEREIFALRTYLTFLLLRKLGILRSKLGVQG